MAGLNAVHKYYHDNPVIRVRYASCSTLPKASGDTQKPDAAPATGNVEAYLSEYSPESTEEIAHRLDQLQKLLIKDGVTIR